MHLILLLKSIKRETNNDCKWKKKIAKNIYTKKRRREIVESRGSAATAGKDIKTKLKTQVLIAVIYDFSSLLMISLYFFYYRAKQNS